MAVLASGPEAVSSGARMTWTGQFSYGANSLKNELLSSSPYDALATIGAYLKNHYQLVIERSDNGVSWWSGNGSLTLYLRTDMDRGDGDSDDGLSDIGGNVSDAFVSQGFPCTAWAIPTYTPASNDGQTQAPTQNTGTQQTTTQQQQDAQKDNSKPFDLLSYLGLGGVGTTIAAGGAGLLIGGVVVLGLVVFLLLQPKATVAA